MPETLPCLSVSTVMTLFSQIPWAGSAGMASGGNGKIEHKALELAEDFSEQYAERRHGRIPGCAAQRSGSEGCRSRRQRGGQGSQRGGQAETKPALAATADMTRRVSRLKCLSGTLSLPDRILLRPGNSMDADPLELNTQAGIINLVTGAFRPNQQEAYCTKLTAFSRNDKGKGYLGFFSGYDHLREQQPKRIPSDGCRYVALWQGLSGGRYLCRWHR